MTTALLIEISMKSYFYTINMYLWKEKAPIIVEQNIFCAKQKR